MIDPVLIKIGFLEIRWYSLAYILGILCGLKYINFLDKKTYNLFTKDLYDKIMIPIVLSIIIGGRLGYVIFYNLDYYLNNPIIIFQTWKGGMSFHGGLIGLVLGILLFCLNQKLPYFKIMDLIALATPIGIFFGRIANFINNELYGRPSNVIWAMKFLPYETIKRHPTQLYEAFTEGILTFLIINISFIKFKLFHHPGKVCGLFLISYSIFRILIENFREPDSTIGFLYSYFTMGQILSLPLLLTGIILFNKK